MTTTDINSVSDFLTQLKVVPVQQCCFRGESKIFPGLISRVGRLHPPRDFGFDEFEKELLQRFIDESVPYLDQINRDWYFIIMAQEHGLPTRLLDWTKNPLVGLFFAVNNHFSENGYFHILRYNQNQYFNELKDDSILPFEIDKLTVFKPRYYTKRIQAQEGYFTIKPDPKAPIIKSEVKDLITYKIPKEKKPDIFYQLQYCGINWHTIFHDLDHLCKHIEDKVRGNYYP